MAEETITEAPGSTGADSNAGILTEEDLALSFAERVESETEEKPTEAEAEDATEAPEAEAAEEEEAERTKAAVEEAMTISPEWALNLPVACESKVADHYLK